MTFTARAFACLLVLAVDSGAAGGGTAARAQSPSKPDVSRSVSTFHVQGNVHLLVGGGANIVVQAGPEGVLVVDSGDGTSTDGVLDAIRRLSDEPIRYLVNTSADRDHVMGNERLARTGRWFTALDAADPVPAQIIAHESALKAMTQMEVPPFGLPSLPYFTGKKEVYFNGESVQVLYQPAAHSDGDSIVFFRRSDVISTGDIFLMTGFPVFDESRGGIDGVIAALNRVIDLTTPNMIQEAGTLVVPGHGRIGDEYDVVEYRDMLTIIRGRVEYYVRQGMSLTQVKSQRPTADYDGRWGATTGGWTTERFIDAVYAGVKRRLAK